LGSHHSQLTVSVENLTLLSRRFYLVTLILASF